MTSTLEQEARTLMQELLLGRGSSDAHYQALRSLTAQAVYVSPWQHPPADGELVVCAVLLAAAAEYHQLLDAKLEAAQHSHKHMRGDRMYAPWDIPERPTRFSASRWLYEAAEAALAGHADRDRVREILSTLQGWS